MLLPPLCSQAAADWRCNRYKAVLDNIEGRMRHYYRGEAPEHRIPRMLPSQQLDSLLAPAFRWAKCMGLALISQHSPLLHHLLIVQLNSPASDSVVPALTQCQETAQIAGSMHWCCDTQGERELYAPQPYAFASVRQTRISC